MSIVAYQSPWMDDELRIFRKTVRQFIQEQFVLDELVEDRVAPISQDLKKRTFYGRWKRPGGN